MKCSATRPTGRSRSGPVAGDDSTIAYFSVDVNPDGTIQTSGPGWDGYESGLHRPVDAAHKAGDRVVLTATDFSQIITRLAHP